MAASDIKKEPSFIGKSSIKIPQPQNEWYQWDLELSPKSKLISNLIRLNHRLEKNGFDTAKLKQNSYDFNELKFRSGILSGVDHSWSISLKPECNYITTTLELPDDNNFSMGITDNSHMEFWQDKDGTPELFLYLKIQFSKTPNTKRNSWTNQARLLDTSWTEKVTLIRITFNLSVQMIVRASVMGFDPLLPLTAIQPKTNCLKEDNNNNSTISIGMQLLNSGQLSDVILICEGIEIPAHRLILSCRSSVFCAMFERKEMKEAQEGRVLLEEIDLPTLKLVLEFVYTGELEKFKLSDNAMDLYRTADRFGILDLKSLCSQQLLSQLKADNAVDIYAVANTHNDQDMMSAALQVIKYNRKEAFKHSETLKEFCVAFPETMFKLFQAW